MSKENPQTYEEWLEDMRTRSDADISVYRTRLNQGALHAKAAEQVYHDREAAKAKKIRDEEFERLAKIKQEREAEHQRR